MDVLYTVLREIVAKRREEVVRGEEGFSYEYLRRGDGREVLPKVR